jgi:hypothetical protein
VKRCLSHAIQWLRRNGEGARDGGCRRDRSLRGVAADAVSGERRDYVTVVMSLRVVHMHICLSETAFARLFSSVHAITSGVLCLAVGISF